MALKILTGKPTGERPLGRPRRRGKDNTRMDLKRIVINTRNWVDSAQDRDFFCICICFDGMVIAAQCTATFSKIYCAPPNLGIRT